MVIATWKVEMYIYIGILRVIVFLLTVLTKVDWITAKTPSRYIPWYTKR